MDASFAVLAQLKWRDRDGVAVMKKVVLFAQDRALPAGKVTSMRKIHGEPLRNFTKSIMKNSMMNEWYNRYYYGVRNLKIFGW